MAGKNLEPYLDPVSEGTCEVVDCASAAKYRASWAQGVIIRLLCASHKADVEGQPFEKLNFRRKRRS